MAWKYLSEWPADKLLKKNFGPDTPYINDIVYNTSMVFVNGHFTLDGPRPLVPNMVEIGGIHVKEPRPLPAVNHTLPVIFPQNHYHCSAYNKLKLTYVYVTLL